MAEGRNHIRRRLNLQDFGDGTQPMLFAQGFGCDQGLWRGVAPAFADRFRVILYDGIGAGGSDSAVFDARRHSTFRGHSDDLLAICEAFDLRNVVFVGHSTGAMVGPLAAIEAPERFDRLVLIGGSPCYLKDGAYRGGFDSVALHELLEYMDGDFRGWAMSVAPLIMGNPSRPELGDMLADSLCRAEPDLAKLFLRMAFFSDHRADLPRLRRPTLLLQSGGDVIAPDFVGRYMQARMPRSRLVQLRATGHCPQVSHPTEVVAAIREELGLAASVPASATAA